jgi:hypothetical protein
MSPNEIRAQVASYLAKGMDLDSFEDWIAQNTWNVHQSGDLGAERLVYSVETKLSEHSSGHLNEKSLRRELFALLSASDDLAKTGASNLQVENPLLLPVQWWQPVDREYEVVSV